MQISTNFKYLLVMIALGTTSGCIVAGLFQDVINGQVLDGSIKNFCLVQ
jgi:hypothetical protein